MIALSAAPFTAAFGYATAYASIVIALMVLAVIASRVLVGSREVARRELPPPA